MRIYYYQNQKYIIVAEINKNEAYRLDFATCKEPRETLQSFYNRQSTKPTLLVNAGFFNMSNGDPVFNFVDESRIQASSTQYKWGMGIKGDNDLIYGYQSQYQWRDFMSGYPNLIDGGKRVKIDFATEINYKARRTMLGYNKSKIYVVCVENPGITFNIAQSILLDLGCEYAINLDGGGSTNMLINGVKKTKDAYNRAVDNVFAVYSNTAILDETKDTATAGNTSSSSSTSTGSNASKVQYINNNNPILKPDSIKTIIVDGKTLKINRKICPDNLVSNKNIADHVKIGQHMKPCAKVDNGSGHPRGITIHNTDVSRVQSGTTAAEQSARAFYNGYGGGAVVHYFVDDTCIWQILETDYGKVERGWHASDGSIRRSPHSGSRWSSIGGNLDTIAIECIGNSAIAEDTTARLAAYLCYINKLDPNIDIYTHNYFMGMEEKIVTFLPDGSRPRKNCPVYILPHLSTFISNVKKYYDTIIKSSSNNTETKPDTNKEVLYYRVVSTIACANLTSATLYLTRIKSTINNTVYRNTIIPTAFKLDYMYTIQFGAFANLQNANNMIEILKSIGIKSKIVTVYKK